MGIPSLVFPLKRRCQPFVKIMEARKDVMPGQCGCGAGGPSDPSGVVCPNCWERFRAGTLPEKPAEEQHLSVEARLTALDEQSKALEAKLTEALWCLDIIQSKLDRLLETQEYSLGGPAPAAAATQEDDFVSKLASSAAVAAVSATAVTPQLSNPRAAAQQLVQRLETSAADKDEEWDV